MLSDTWTASLGLTYTIIRSYPPGPTPLGDGSYGDESYKGPIVQGTYDLWKNTRGRYIRGRILTSSNYGLYPFHCYSSKVVGKCNCKASTKHISTILHRTVPGTLACSLSSTITYKIPRLSGPWVPAMWLAKGWRRNERPAAHFKIYFYVICYHVFYIVNLNLTLILTNIYSLCYIHEKMLIWL